MPVFIFIQNVVVWNSATCVVSNARSGSSDQKNPTSAATCYVYKSIYEVSKFHNVLSIKVASIAKQLKQKISNSATCDVPSVDGNENLMIQLHIHSRPKMNFFYIYEYDVAAPFSF